MNRTLHKTVRRHVRSERGATMVEFAILSVALFTFIFLIIEGAFAVRARTTVSNATDDAARRGAIAGTSVDADFRILRQLTGRGAADAAEIDFVVVYSASSSTAPVPADCIDGIAVDGVCNVYTPDDFVAPRAAFGCEGLGSEWCPTMRDPGSDIGFLGVYVEGEYEPILGAIILDTTLEVNAQSAQAIETSGDSTTEEEGEVVG